MRMYYTDTAYGRYVFGIFHIQIQRMLHTVKVYISYGYSVSQPARVNMASFLIRISGCKFRILKTTGVQESLWNSVASQHIDKKSVVQRSSTVVFRSFVPNQTSPIKNIYTVCVLYIRCMCIFDTHTVYII